MIHQDKIIALKEMPTGGSDVNLKQDIRTLDNTLEKVLSLRPVKWRWKAGGSRGKLRYGFIAQEVEKIFPDLVSDEIWKGDETISGDGSLRKHIAPTDLVPYLVSALIEQHHQIEEMKVTLQSIKKDHLSN